VENHPDTKLPGLNFTPQQMFWIIAGQEWCDVVPPEQMKLSIETDVHSPARFRVIGMMSNAKEFAADFNCPSKAPMNPETKCDVW
jgi:neprilysin